ncbi:DUF5615 family PIN-like protein [Oscillatoria sp. CS-180]|uniref:DUF5615 family PIN-like protein n=1 Tax=Oscillatoria sp. CS-180 TaxID=3021720 RepID=UPI0023302A0A|nr:DUF5615 family PIN-like protein [Oscillatoria sp. CS-180]MDB9529588.1 DUF5615 family PIN-like protein [Oscillatoria sp. CS-180]
MARFYSNENLPIDLVNALRALDHDVLTSYEAEQANQRIPDADVLTYATTKNRIVITLNRKDFIALHQSGLHHSGIIICKEDRDYVGQAQALHDYLVNSGDELSDRLLRVQKQNRPQADQQIFVIREYSQ